MSDKRALVGGGVGLVLGTIMIALAVPLAWRDGSRGPVRGGERTLEAIDADGVVSPEEEAQARALLKEQPGFGGAYRVLGQAALQRKAYDKADTLLGWAVKLDPREVTARALLIDRAYVKRDALALAEHTDALLRIAPETAPQLLQQIVALLQAPDVRAALVARVRADTPWRGALASYLAQSPHPESAVAYLDVLANKLTLTEAEQRTRLQLLLAIGAVEQARKTWVQALPNDLRGLAQGNLFDGGFEGGETPPPFGWVIQPKPGVIIAPDPTHIEGQSSLALVFEGREVQGIGLSQILTLAPGHYRLTGQANNATTAPRPFRWLLRCEGNSTLSIGQVDLLSPVASDWQKVVMEFTIPEGCMSQTLSLTYPARSKSERLITGTMYIDALTIDRLR